MGPSWQRLCGAGPVGQPREGGAPAAYSWAARWAEARGECGSGLGRGREGEMGRGWRKRGWAEREKGEGFPFFFSFLLFSFYFKAVFTSFQNILNHFKILSSNTLITINKMQRHACSSMFLCPMMNFNLMKILSPYVS